MALTVEDGTVIANADSFVDETAADAYFTAHDNPATWTGSTSALQESALKYAAQTLGGAFDWEGKVTSLTQTLCWPRSSAADREDRTIASNVIPQAVKDAQCELALIHLGTALNQTHDRGGAVISEKIGPIETRFSENAPAEATWPYIERILNGLGKHRGTLQPDIERA